MTAAGQITATAVLTLPPMLILEPPWALRPGLLSWGAVLGLSLLSTAAGHILYYRILASAGATNTMLVNYLVPVSAVLLGVLILGERLEWTAFAGMEGSSPAWGGGGRGLPARLQFHSAGRLFTRVPLTSPRPDTKLRVRFWPVVRRTFIYI